MRKELLEILVCPETHQSLFEATAETVAKINRLIAEGKLINRALKPVGETVEGALIRRDGQFLYPIRNGIPVMLVEESIPMV